MDVSIWVIHENIKRVCEELKSTRWLHLECYLYEEAIEFCNEFLSNVEAIGLSKRVSTKVTYGFGKIGQIVFTVSKNLLCQTYRYVLNDTDEVHVGHLEAGE